VTRDARCCSSGSVSSNLRYTMVGFELGDGGDPGPPVPLLAATLAAVIEVIGTVRAFGGDCGRSRGECTGERVGALGGEVDMMGDTSECRSLLSISAWSSTFHMPFLIRTGRYCARCSAHDTIDTNCLSGTLAVRC